MPLTPRATTMHGWVLVMVFLAIASSTAAIKQNDVEYDDPVIDLELQSRYHDRWAWYRQPKHKLKCQGENSEKYQSEHVREYQIENFLRATHWLDLTSSWAEGV